MSKITCKIHVFYDANNERAKTLVDNLFVWVKSGYTIVYNPAHKFLVENELLIFLTDEMLPTNGICVQITDALLENVCKHSHSILDLCYKAVESGNVCRFFKPSKKF